MDTLGRCNLLGPNHKGDQHSAGKVEKFDDFDENHEISPKIGLEYQLREGV